MNASADSDGGQHPQSPPAQNGRKGSKKVRSGCITCKTRKVKCDEAKPYCLRCTDTGRKCDGYLDAAALAMRRRRRRPPVSSAAVYAEAVSGGLSGPGLLDADALAAPAPPASSPAVPLPQLGPATGPGCMSPEERRSFDFFQRITAPSLAGDLDAAFWRVLVLQVCHTEPAVRHAALAVSSLHEAFLRPPTTPMPFSSSLSSSASPYSSSSEAVSRQFALRQYNKAIVCLLEAMRAADKKKGQDQPTDCARSPLKHPVAPLMTCVLFVCIEVMQGKDKEALLHLEKGRHILSQLSRGGALDDAANPEMAVVRQHLVPLYTRLSMTSFLFGGSPVVLPTSFQSGGAVPDNFSCIYSLRCTLYDFVDAVLRFTQQARRVKYAPSSSSCWSPRRRSFVSSATSTPSLNDLSGWPQLEAEQGRLSRQLVRLRVAQTLFRVSQSTGGASATLGTAMALLEMHLCIATIWLATALAKSETVFDEHLATFSSIVSLAATVLDAEHQYQTFPASNRTGGHTHRSSHSSARSRRQDGQDETAGAGPPTVFMLETRVIPALYYVATKCRHPLVRRAALGLLKRRRGRRENLWRADTLGAIASRIVQIEEGSTVAVKSEDAQEPGKVREPNWRNDEELMDPFFPVKDTTTTMFMTSETNALYASWENPAEWMTDAAGFGSLSPVVTDGPGLAETQVPQTPQAPHSATEPFPVGTGRRQSTEAPFDLPERARVHTAVIGAEEAGSVWATVFRKPQGLDGAWDVQSELIAVDTYT